MAAPWRSIFGSDNAVGLTVASVLIFGRWDLGSLFLVMGVAVWWRFVFWRGGWRRGGSAVLFFALDLGFGLVFWAVFVDLGLWPMGVLFGSQCNIWYAFLG